MTRQRIRIGLTAMLLAAAALGAAAFGADAKPSLPDGLKGFRGNLFGIVVSVQADGKGFVEKIDAVLPARDSKATNPRSAEGKSVLIDVRPVQDASGKRRPDGDQVGYVKRLKVGKQVSLFVINDKGERLHIQSLPID